MMSVNTHINLRYPLDQFRLALEAEIEAASTEAATRPVALFSGKRIARIGSGWQYLFTAESPLSIHADSPAELQIEEEKGIVVTVVACEGLKLTLSLSTDFGLRIPRALLRFDLTFLLRRLIDRIEEYSSKRNPAGDRLLGAASPSGTPLQVSFDNRMYKKFDEPNDSQKRAVCSALGRDTTFIWGPPGTGKTETIGMIGGELFDRGRTLLLLSHTNTAVDQALWKVAGRLEAGGYRQELENGAVLRVGDPRDIRFNNKPELLLSEQVKRRSETLARKQASLEEERALLEERIRSYQRRLDLIEWVNLAAADLERHWRALREIEVNESRCADAERKVESLRARMASLAPHLELASQLLERLGDLRRILELVRTAGEARAGELGSLHLQRSAQRDQTTLVIQEERRLLKAERELFRSASAHGALVRRWKGLPNPSELQASISKREQQLGERERLMAHLTAAIEGYEREQVSLSAQIDLANAVLEQLSRGSATVGVGPGVAGGADGPLDLVGPVTEFEHLSSEYVEFRDHVGFLPDSLIELHSETAIELTKGEEELGEVREGVGQQRRTLHETLEGQLEVLADFDLVDRSQSPAELREKVKQLARVADRVRDDVCHEVPEKLLSDLRAANNSIDRVILQLEDIAESLANVERDLVGSAQIVATTLCRAYLRDYISERLFDTVLLDEASMAPIPSLWVTAGGAAASVVVVGDPKQLPPIKHSRLELVNEWLGRDIFSLAGLETGKGDGTSLPPHLVQLTTQYRMHPDISGIPNTLIYCHSLVDGDCTRNEQALDCFFDRGWGHDEAVVLFDMGPLFAWANTVERGSSTSRINLLSAVVSANLAHRVLRADREPHLEGSSPRILIVSPYRPQANLVGQLLRHHKLDGEVEAGTAHSFQGSEAPVVILDLVVDEPHWRANIFTPDYDDTSRRLLNVAITRAQKRLFLIGDFDYLAAKGAKAFLGKHLIPHVQRSTRIDAASCLLEQTGSIADQGFRCFHRTAQFRDQLSADLAAAVSRVIIYSPRMDGERVEDFAGQIGGLTRRGVAVYVITQPLRERASDEISSYQNLEDRLQGMGVYVLYKRSMHEKVLLLDDLIVWTGSFHLFSSAEEEGFIDRRVSKDISSFVNKHLCTAELTSSVNKREDVCPVCGERLEIAEGKRGPYWRCARSCFTRSLTQPYPKDGLLSCSSCGGEIEFGFWGDRPHWRCIENRRHRQPIYPQHLHLPKMTSKIPSKDLRKLRLDWSGS